VAHLLTDEWLRRVAAVTERYADGQAAEMIMRSIYDLTTEEAYRLVTEHFGHDLPPLDAVENEDWGRDYVLQHFQRHSEEELAAAGLTWREPDETG
jgi:hypothetical protein